ncbi:MAG: DUF928 domain-containing protein [Scytonematopsis contorta HA4267-MV1]|jgi:hypothetical protein|nr:DUF928 domain-containing protein [Scytonematopsis contorta HA4267-MV1]
MSSISIFQSPAFFFCSLVFSLVLFPLSSIQAQNTNSSSGGTFNPTSAPKTTSGGGSRGNCAMSKPEILLPETSANEIQQTIQQTTEAYPTVSIKITESVPEKAEFSLWDENLKGLYQTTYTLPNKPGIFNFKLPKEAPSLTFGKRYKYSIALICDQERRSRDVVIEGWIQRIQPNQKLIKL